MYFLCRLFEIDYLRFAAGDVWRPQGLICNFLVNWSAIRFSNRGTPITLSLVMFNPFAFKKIGGIFKGHRFDLLAWPEGLTSPDGAPFLKTSHGWFEFTVAPSHQPYESLGWFKGIFTRRYFEHQKSRYSSPFITLSNSGLEVRNHRIPIFDHDFIEALCPTGIGVRPTTLASVSIQPSATKGGSIFFTPTEVKSIPW